MLSIRFFKVFYLVLITSVFVIAACNTAAPAVTELPVNATQVPAAEVPVPTAKPSADSTAEPTAEIAVVTEIPTAAPITRHGGWLDAITFSMVEKDSAISQLQSGAIDIYADGLESKYLPEIQAAKLNTNSYYGLYYSIMYNPTVFTDSKTLNPFSNRKIREATNMLYDRNEINQNFYAGGGLSKFFAIQTNGTDYTELVDTVRALEEKYAYNLEKAQGIIKTEMEGMGAVLGADGKWMFKKKPVTLVFLIRSDGDGTRQPVGDYVATQLEKAGFTVDRQYKLGSEATPIWQSFSGKSGKWSMYTAAWSWPEISRNQMDMFQQMYLPGSVQETEPFKSNSPDPVFKTLGDDLAIANFKTLDERTEMMIKALSLSLEDSLQVWLIDGKNYTPSSIKLNVIADQATGIEDSQIWPKTAPSVNKENAANIWPFTLRFSDQIGGQPALRSIKWGQSDLFGAPWNPIAGSRQSFDLSAIHATSSGDTMSDPYSGLVWPLRIEKAEVTIKTGMAVGKTLDWVTLNTADEIKVPADAWSDWDARAQVFRLAGEGVTANRKTVVTYPAELFKTVKWHDGSPLSVGDFVMRMIMTFDRAKRASAIYDIDNAVSAYTDLMKSFKGIKITSTEPLVIEYYSDAFDQDAELNIPAFWPTYGTGEGSWSVLAVANAAEAAGELAYSADKAGANGAKPIEQTSFIGGPSLDILAKYLDTAAADKLIPYAPTLGQYITADEAASRYANMKAWYAAHNHFWIGTGPYFLDTVNLSEKTLTLKSNTDFPDLSNRWENLSKP